jgi:hypothetical protein
MNSKENADLLEKLEKPDSTNVSREDTPERKSDKKGLKNKKNSPKSVKSNTSKKKVYKCLICMENFEKSDEYKLTIKIIPGCEHTFCTDCLNEYLKIEIIESKFPITCPGEGKKCESKFPPNFIFEIVDEKMKNKFWQFNFKKYIVDMGDKFFGCPTADCQYGIEIDEKNPPTNSKFSCQLCNKKYCLKCKCEYHEGKTCSEFKGKKNNKDEENFLEYAKREKIKMCPKCKTWIEKIDGCNHMTCSKCKYEFCYICGEPTKTPTHPNCSFKFEAALPSSSDRSETLISHRNENEDVRSRFDNSRTEYYANVVNRMYENYERTSIRQGGNEIFSSINRLGNNYLKEGLNDFTSFDNRPRKKDGTLDMRYAVNKQSKDNTGVSSTSKSNLIDIGPGPTKKDGTLDMRYSVNKDLVNMKVDSARCGPTKKDGTLDMRYSINKNYVGPQSTTTNSMSNSYYGLGPTKKDGTLDMRYSVNKSYVSSQPSYGSSYGSSYNYGSGPTKKDGTLDMRYSVNKAYASSSASSYKPSSSYNYGSSYSGGGRSSGYSGYSSGPLKSDGTPDMRYSSNRRR